MIILIEIMIMTMVKMIMLKMIVIIREIIIMARKILTTIIALMMKGIIVSSRWNRYCTGTTIIIIIMTLTIVT